MGYLDGIVDISDLGQRKLVVLYGKSNSGKTEFGSTFPKPLLYMQLGDDGANTIARKANIKAKRINTIEELRGTLKELIKIKAKGYETVFIDTFSMISNVWVDENVISKNKKMTQQLWGDLKTDTEEIIRLAHKLSLYCWVILSCHEAADAFEGLEDEIMPDVRPSVTKGARTYLEGMANYGFHTTKLQKEVVSDGVEKTLVKYACHIGPNPYYWTKVQADKSVKIPKILVNPTYKRLQEVGIVE